MSNIGGQTFSQETDLTLNVEEVTPASASAAGVKGLIVFDSNYIYVCIATDTWKRVAIATWV